MIGAALRLRQYLFNRSLWYDEALLANQLVHRSFRELLDATSGAPFAFLASARAVTVALGMSDWALRLVPLAAGLATLELARRLAQAAWRTAPAQVAFIALTALSAPLVYYSSEFKPYGVDLAMTLALWLLGLEFDAEHPSPRTAILLALTGAAAVWVSWASPFVLAAVGTTLWIEAAWHRRTASIGMLTLVGIAWATSFAASYLASLHTLSGNPLLEQYWSGAYAPSPLVNASWYRDSLLELAYLPFAPPGPLGMEPHADWWTPVTAAVASAAAIGVPCLWLSSARLFCFAAGATAITIAASGLHAYPFSGRLILFLAPVVLAALAALVEQIAERARRAAFVAVTVSAAVTSVAAMQSVPIAWAPAGKADIKGAIEFIRTHRTAGDALALSVWSKPSWQFYAPGLGLEDMPTTVEIPAAESATSFLRDTSERGIHGRVWIVMSHRMNERFRFFTIVQQKARRLETWEGTGAGAYLLDLP